MDNTVKEELKNILISISDDVNEIDRAVLKTGKFWNSDAGDLLLSFYKEDNADINHLSNDIICKINHLTDGDGSDESKENSLNSLPDILLE